jgi:hypothetical protein
MLLALFAIIDWFDRPASSHPWDIPSPLDQDYDCGGWGAPSGYAQLR